jgi:hypothetical protein
MKDDCLPAFGENAKEEETERDLEEGRSEYVKDLA